MFNRSPYTIVTADYTPLLSNTHEVITDTLFSKLDSKLVAFSRGNFDCGGISLYCISSNATALLLLLQGKFSDTEIETTLDAISLAIGVSNFGFLNLGLSTPTDNITPTPPTPSVDNALLTEDGDYIITEEGDYIILE